MTSPLIEARKNGFVELVRLLLKYGARASQADAGNNTALHWAAGHNHRNCAAVLLDCKRTMEVTNADGNTPLMEAAAKLSVEMVQFLLQHAASCCFELNQWHKSALAIASFQGDMQIVCLMLHNANATEDRSRELYAALAAAATGNFVQIAQKLLDYGACVNYADAFILSPLHSAALAGSREVTKLLLSYGANLEDFDNNGYTPLMEAAKAGHEEMIITLLCAGAKADRTSEDGRYKASDLFSRSRHSMAARMLLLSEAADGAFM
ncbi:Ankyrin repeat and KH domain-containing protein 1 [Taenia crassiceps]|uniref:Ankyrin repeat and KH domain-containing protein 1 n=1 Tax=Taenia crassiceps TaxID=6207 RepID=A0ABR4QEV3_9CEST